MLIKDPPEPCLTQLMMENLSSAATLKSPTSKFLKNVQNFYLIRGEKTILQVALLVSKFCQNQVSI